MQTTTTTRGTTRRRQPTEAQKAAARAKREALKELSDQLGPAPAGMRMNDLILAYYQQQTGHSQWHSFKGWKDLGFSVNKGESGFPVWGQPRDLRPSDDASDADDQPKKDGKPAQFFPLAYLFHAGQVSDAEGNAPAADPALAEIADAAGAALDALFAETA